MTFHKVHTAGEMIERIDGDATALSNFLQFVVKVLGTGVLMAGVLIIMFLEDWRIGLAMSAYALLVLLVLRQTKGLAVPFLQSPAPSLRRFIRVLGNASPASKTFAPAEPSNTRCASNMALCATCCNKVCVPFCLAAFFSFVLILFAVGNATAIGVGGYLLGLGALTLGTVYLIFDYTVPSSNLRVITEQLDDLQRASAGIERVGELLRIQSQIQEPSQPVPIAAQTGALTLRFEQVSLLTTTTNRPKRTPAARHQFPIECG